MGLKGGYVKKAWRLPASHGLYTFDSTSSDKPAAIIDNQGMYFGIVLGMLAQKSLAHAAVQIALLHLGLGAFFDEVWIALEGGAGGGYKGGKAGRNGEPQSGRDGVYTLREASDVGGTLAVASRLLMTVVQPVLSTQQATHTTRPSFECLKFHTEADHVLAAVVNGMYASVDEADETMEENDDGSGEGEVAKSESASGPRLVDGRLAWSLSRATHPARAEIARQLENPATLNAQHPPVSSRPSSEHSKPPPSLAQHDADQRPAQSPDNAPQIVVPDEALRWYARQLSQQISPDALAPANLRPGELVAVMRDGDQFFLFSDPNTLVLKEVVVIGDSLQAVGTRMGAVWRTSVMLAKDGIARWVDQRKRLEDATERPLRCSLLATIASGESFVRDLDEIDVRQAILLAHAIHGDYRPYRVGESGLVGPVTTTHLAALARNDLSTFFSLLVESGMRLSRNAFLIALTRTLVTTGAPSSLEGGTVTLVIPEVPGMQQLRRATIDAVACEKGHPAKGSDDDAATWSTIFHVLDILPTAGTSLPPYEQHLTSLVGNSLPNTPFGLRSPRLSQWTAPQWSSQGTDKLFDEVCAIIDGWEEHELSKEKAILKMCLSRKATMNVLNLPTSGEVRNIVAQIAQNHGVNDDEADAEDAEDEEDVPDASAGVAESEERAGYQESIAPVARAATRLETERERADAARARHVALAADRRDAEIAQLIKDLDILASQRPFSSRPPSHSLHPTYRRILVRGREHIRLEMSEGEWVYPAKDALKQFHSIVVSGALAAIAMASEDNKQVDYPLVKQQVTDEDVYALATRIFKDQPSQSAFVRLVGLALACYDIQLVRNPGLLEGRAEQMIKAGSATSSLVAAHPAEFLLGRTPGEDSATATTLRIPWQLFLLLAHLTSTESPLPNPSTSTMDVRKLRSYLHELHQSNLAFSFPSSDHVHNAISQLRKLITLTSELMALFKPIREATAAKVQGISSTVWTDKYAKKLASALGKQYERPRDLAWPGRGVVSSMRAVQVVDQVAELVEELIKLLELEGYTKGPVDAKEVMGGFRDLAVSEQVKWIKWQK